MMLCSSSRSLSRTAVSGAVTALTLMALAGGAMAQATVVPDPVEGKRLWNLSCGAAGGCHNDPVAGVIYVDTSNQFAHFGADASNIKNAGYNIGASSSGVANRTKGKNQMKISTGAIPNYTDDQFNHLAAYLAQVSGRTLLCTSAGVPTATALATGVACPVPAAPAATVSSTTAFSTVAGTAATPQTVTLTSTGTAALNITSVSWAVGSDAAFSFVNNCPASLTAAGGATTSCTITVNYVPNAVTASAAATLNIATDAGTKAVALSGTATAAPAPAMSLSTTTQSLSANVGATNNGTVITLTNNGTADLTGLAISASPTAYSFTTTCTATVAKNGGNCTITPNFTATSAGAAAAGQLSISGTNVATQRVTLNGIGTQPAIGFNTTSLTFSAQPGGTTVSQHVTLTNTGDGPLTISGVTLPAGFSATTNSCVTTPAAVIAAKATCGFDVAFTGGATQASGTPSPVTINTADTLGTGQTLNLTGNTLAAAAPTLVWVDATGATLASTSLTVGTAAVTVGGTVTATIALKNTNPTSGSVINIATPLVVTPGAGTTTSEFSVSNPTCTPATTPTLCTYTVSFTPSSAGAKTATLHVNEPGSVIPLDFTVTGAAAAAPAPASSSGGGCTIGGAGDAADPLWLVMLAGAGLALRRRNKRA